ncbi:UNVERIFIED_CONTAM: 60S acidic ribosomal protein P1 [Gekko kuhli]
MSFFDIPLEWHNNVVAGRNQNEHAFDEIIQKANFTTYEFRIRVKLETFNDESRLKATAMDVKPVNHKEYSKRLIMNIRKNNAQLQ